MCAARLTNGKEAYVRMNIMAWIIAFILAGNALLAQGWRYDLATGTFLPPPQVESAEPLRAPARN